jgi:hypothetical protein
MAVLYHHRRCSLPAPPSPIKLAFHHSSAAPPLPISLPLKSLLEKKEKKKKETERK